METEYLCPECKTGSISIENAETPTTIAPPFHRRGDPLETRLRPCVIAVCNGCEFCYELTPDGLANFEGATCTKKPRANM